MKQPIIKFEIVLYGLAFLLACALRFAALGAVPLSNPEADLALQALSLARGEETLLGPHPAYIVLTTALMSIFDAGNFVARFWPALAGSLIVIAPFFFRGWLGRIPAVLLAVFLAIDPGMVAVSRQAGSLPLAVSFTVLAFGLWAAGHAAWAGILAGLSLLSGPAAWPVWISLLLALWAAPVESQDPTTAEEKAAPRHFDWRRASIFALGTIVFIGTLFFIVPRGLGSMAESLPAYLSSWVQPSGVPITRLLIGLLVYAFIPLIFGLATLVARFKESMVRFLGLWWIAALLLALIPAGREMGSLSWSLVPLWALAAMQIARLLHVPEGDRLATLGHAALTAVILAFIVMDLAALANNNQVRQDPIPDYIALASAAVLLVATTILVAWGWSSSIALRGFVWGVGAVLLLFTVAATFNSAQLSTRQGRDLWFRGAVFQDEDLFVRTLSDLSLWNTGERNRLETVVAGISSPALRWALRDYDNVEFVAFLPQTASPAIVITENVPELALGATYRGQDLILSQTPIWNMTSAAQWFRWLVFREVPVQTEMFVLWARTDLFPGEVEQANLE